MSPLEMDLLCGSAGGGPEQILSPLSKVGRSGSEQILARFSELWRSGPEQLLLPFSEIWRSGSEKIQPPFSKIWRLRIGVRMSALLPRRPKEQRQRADPSQIGDSGGMERSMTTWKSAFRAAVAASRLIGNSAMVTPSARARSMSAAESSSCDASTAPHVRAASAS